MVCLAHLGKLKLANNMKKKKPGEIYSRYPKVRLLFE